MSATVDTRASTAPDKSKIKAPTPLYTKNGKPRQRYLRALVRALPQRPLPADEDARSAKSRANLDGTKRLGLGRAEMRAYVRAEQRKEVHEVVPKALPRPIWRNVAYAFRRFNPEGLASNQRLEQREAA